MIQFRASICGDPGVSTSAGFDTTRRKMLISVDRPSGDTLHFWVGATDGAALTVALGAGVSGATGLRVSGAMGA